VMYISVCYVSYTVVVMFTCTYISEEPPRGQETLG
jgi:hypothetical protein